MKQQKQKLWCMLRASVLLLAMFTVLLGGVYPFSVWLLSKAAFSQKVEGSLLTSIDGKVIGSAMLGQPFTQPKYFWGRLSATTPPYNAAASSGSNLSPANPAFMNLVNERISALKKADPKNDKPIPVDLVTASASGLDPHISVKAAEYQLARVAKARGRKENDIRVLLATHTHGANGIFMEPHVNVLRLNMALDKLEVSGY